MLDCVWLMCIAVYADAGIQKRQMQRDRAKMIVKQNVCKYKIIHMCTGQETDENEDKHISTRRQTSRHTDTQHRRMEIK